jgi:hypothetical protein
MWKLTWGKGYLFSNLVLKFKCVNNCFASNMLLIFKWWNSKVSTYKGIVFTLKMLNYFSSNGVLRAGLWECQVWISHRHIRGRPNLLSYSHSHCIIVSKRESWFDVRTEPKKNKENKIRVWTVSDKAVVCEQWVLRPVCVKKWLLRPLCVKGDTAGVNDEC